MSQAQVSLDPECPNHSGTEATLVCLQCDEVPACVKCVVSSHAQHKLAQIDDHIPQYKERIHQRIRYTKSADISAITDVLTKSSDMMARSNAETTTLLDEIDERGRKLHQLVEVCVQEYKTTCKQIQLSNQPKMRDYCTRLTKELKEKNNDVARLEKALKSSATKSEIIAAARGNQQHVSVPAPSERESVMLTSSNIQLDGMKQLLGLLQIRNDTVPCLLVNNPKKKTCPKCGHMGIDFELDVAYI